VTANVTVGERAAEGVIIAQGGGFAGWSLYVKDGKPRYAYNFFGLKTTIVEGTKVVPAGDHQIRMEFDYEGGGLAKGATVRLYVDGQPGGEGRLDATVPMAFSGDETTDVGRDTGTPVSPDYTAKGNEFSGTVHWVQIDIDDKAEDVDHLITPEERMRAAMARQ
jgi:arylsulfatase